VGVADEVHGRPRRLFGEAVVRACWTGLVSLAMGAAHGSTSAAIVEDEMTIPVKVRTVDGRDVERNIRVALFHESKSPQPRPLLVLNHGRAGSAADRAALRTSDYAAAARWLTQFGFVVAVPVRIGYGVTGGEDVEDSGVCTHKVYPPGFRAAADETLAVLRALRQRPEAAQDRSVVMGQSFGGTTAIAVAALDPAGMQGAINFAGGGGGGPVSHPQQPCSQPALRTLFADYGKTARMPTLWLYSENDMYFGPRFPGEWFEAFKASGGTGDYVQFRPVSDNGHLLFSRGTELWHPRVQAFLASLGYRQLAEPPRRRP
jgi:dienelactone hydrolase